MSKTMEAWLETVEWRDTGYPGGRDSDGVPVATHEGILRIGDFELRVYRLSDGRRIVNADDMQEFLLALPGGQ